MGVWNLDMEGGRAFVGGQKFSAANSDQRLVRGRGKPAEFAQIHNPHSSFLHLDQAYFDQPKGPRGCLRSGVRWY